MPTPSDRFAPIEPPSAPSGWSVTPTPTTTADGPEHDGAAAQKTGARPPWPASRRWALGLGIAAATLGLLSALVAGVIAVGGAVAEAAAEFTLYLDREPDGRFAEQAGSILAQIQP